VLIRKIPPIPQISPQDENRTQNQGKVVEIFIKVEILSPPSVKYLHQKTSKSTLKLQRVEVVEMSEILSVYPMMRLG
jgi:hypothetical protein